MNPKASFVFGFLTGAAVMLVILQWMLSSIKRDIRKIIELRELEREIEAKKGPRR